MAKVRSEKAEVSDELSARDLGFYLGCYCHLPTDELVTLQAIWQQGEVLVTGEDSNWSVPLDIVKPVLRSLDDMELLMEVNISTKLKLDMDAGTGFSHLLKAGATTQKILIQNYFDVFGWIDDGLAVDAKTLDTNPYSED